MELTLSTIFNTIKIRAQFITELAALDETPGANLYSLAGRDDFSPLTPLSGHCWLRFVLSGQLWSTVN